VNQSRILPVLDGLDEVPEQVRPQVLDQLNAAAADPLILTCRTTEYETAVADQGRRGLTGAAVIEPSRLKAADAAAYLGRNLPRTAGSGWADLLSTLKASRDGPIRQALSSPLTLWLIRKVYLETHADPAELCDTNRFTTADALTEHLLDHLTEALITPNPSRQDGDEEHPFGPRHAWNPADAKNWLAFLAHHMNTIGTRDLAWWQLSRAVSQAIKVVVGLVFALGLGLIFMFAFGLIFGLDFGLIFGSVFMLALGLVFVGRSSTNDPAYADLRLQGRFRLLWRKLSAWSSIRAGLAFGLLVASELGLLEGVTGGLVGGLGFGLAFGLIFGLIDWAKTPTTYARPQAPAVTLRRDLQLVYFHSLVFGLACGPVFGLVFGVGFLSGLELLALFGLGFVFGLTAGFVFGLGQASGQYLMTVAILRRRRRVPLRLLTFLDDAHRLGILREAGPVYQFRHATLQDRLARAYTPLT
jgi:hypothetical protein